MTLVLGAGLVVLAFRYVSLAGGTETRARQMFEEWKGCTLEHEATSRADVLNREWVLEQGEGIASGGGEAERCYHPGQCNTAPGPLFP